MLIGYRGEEQYINYTRGPIRWLNYRSYRLGRTAFMRGAHATHATRRRHLCNSCALNGENHQEWSSADHRNNQIGNYSGTSHSPLASLFLPLFLRVSSFVRLPLELLRKIAEYEVALRGECHFRASDSGTTLLCRLWLCKMPIVICTVICSSVYQSRLNMCPWYALCRFAHVNILSCMYLYAC